MINLVRLVRGPWMAIGNIWRWYRRGNAVEITYKPHLDPFSYASAVTHTEQIVDWLITKLGANILVKISEKAPCLKCSHYIQYAIKSNNTPVKDA
jgi:hypothetical protein